MNIRETILAFMEEQAYKPMNIKELKQVFGVTKHEYKDFEKMLRDMEKDGQIVKTRTEHYGIPARMGLVLGKLQGHQKVMDLLYQKKKEKIFLYQHLVWMELCILIEY